MSQHSPTYAESGIDYGSIEPFKAAMIEMGRKTVQFPERRGIVVSTQLMHAHGAVFSVATDGKPWVHMCQVTEGLGTKNWISEWMALFAGTGRSYYEGIGIDALMMGANDLIAQGAMPVIFTDEVAAGHSDWFKNEERGRDLAQSFYRGCEMAGVALVAGESPAYPVLVNSREPVKDAPIISGCVTGVIFHGWLVTGELLGPGDVILGAPSSGMHSNGSSLVTDVAMGLPEKFLTRLPNGNMLGDEVLIPTRCYVNLVEALQKDPGVEVHAYLPGTGSGVAKLAFDHRPYNYRVSSWPKREDLAPVFQFMLESGVSVREMFKVFNMGFGYYVFVAEDQAPRAIEVAATADFDLQVIGRVEEGERKVIFEPDGWERQIYNHP